MREQQLLRLRPGAVVRSSLTGGRRDFLMLAFCWCSAATVVGGLVWLLWDVVAMGMPVFSWGFLTESPESFGRSGGIFPILVSTGLILAICLAVALPLGVLTAAWLSEVAAQRPVARRLIRHSLDVLAAVPSIVFGMFGTVFFCQIMQMGFSILAGGLTLALMVLPIVIATVHASFRAIGDDLRSGAAALALGQTTTLFRLLLPAAGPAIVVGLVLGIGRALAETAALIFTSGYVTRMPETVFDSGRTLSVHIYDLAMNVSGGESNAGATAMVLVLLLLVINSITAWLSRRYLQHQVAG